MAQSLVDRTLRTLAMMATETEGVSLTDVATRIELPKSGAHRLLGELIKLGYVRQDSKAQAYFLTTRLVSIGLAYLSATGVTELSQPILDRLAEDSGELVRLAVVDGEGLTWVAKAQGARSGLRYDPDMGGRPLLHCTATGQAWLASMTDEEATRLVAGQGFGKLTDHGPNAPRTIAALIAALERARADGYAQVSEAAELGTAAISAVIIHPKTNVVVGTVSIAGPSMRLNNLRARSLAPKLIEASRDLALANLSAPALMGGMHAQA